MEVGASHAADTLKATSCLELVPPPGPPQPCAPAELRALVHGGQTDSDACETLLAQVARIEGALDLELADGLAALCIGDRLITLGFSNLGDYAREVLDIEERTAQAMARFSRELRSRPLLRAAVRSGEVRPRNAQTVLPVAAGEAEAEWVERARVETVRALEKAVRAVGEEEEWTRFRVRLSQEDRATVDEALAIAGKLMPGSRRPQRLEAMAQEYLAEHALEAGDDGGGGAGGSFRPESDRLERRKAELELETDRWSFLPPAASAAAQARTLSQKVRERDLGRCQMPGCSRRAAVHAHHVELRSRGGADAPENLVALCACHHLRGIHGGYICVWGRAPDELVWKVGGRTWRDGRLGTVSQCPRRESNPRPTVLGNEAGCGDREITNALHQPAEGNEP